MPATLHDTDLAAGFADAACRAGELALAFFRAGSRTNAEVTSKEGGSPVTEADYIVDRFLKETLSALVPDAGWLSEETADTTDRLGKKRVLIVDPIDGTRSFAAGDPNWAVAVTLVADGRPVIGVVHAPAVQETFVATHGGGATCNGRPISVSARTAFDASIRLSGPKPLADDLRAQGLAFALQPRIGSLALRIVHVADGRLDAGLAGGSSHDWDIAAADLILQESGGILAGLDGHAPTYNGVNIRHGLLTAAPLRLHNQINTALRRARGTKP